MYVLVLGLDVLGNPFGLIRGIGEGELEKNRLSSRNLVLFLGLANTIFDFE